ncbi:hypothetical protein EAI_14068 [Harpegnathos saltator]|uniref:Uncharacterized protein n=1 Tax=Harpegnathos saltator TaxID=610380 RepID=E2C7X9_HARSA|nr:hypothetical protein EAI_14068 [Harpegnathos saltator]
MQASKTREEWWTESKRVQEEEEEEEEKEEEDADADNDGDEDGGKFENSGDHIRQTLNIGMDSVFLTAAGKVFQSDGATALKDRLKISALHSGVCDKSDAALPESSGGSEKVFWFLVMMQRQRLSDAMTMLRAAVLAAVAAQLLSPSVANRPAGAHPGHAYFEQPCCGRSHLRHHKGQSCCGSARTEAETDGARR